METIDSEYKILISMMQAIGEKTQKIGLNVWPDFLKKPSVTDSKYGGFPYWDINKKYPVTSKNEPFILLAQFNFAQFTPNNIFPKSGILQFFLSEDRKESKVVYHDRIDEEFTEEKAKIIGLPSTFSLNDTFPVKGTVSAKIKIGITQLHSSDKSYKIIMDYLAKTAGFDKYLTGDMSYYDLLLELAAMNDQQVLYNDKGAKGSWIYGYPLFIQGDERTDDERSKYDTLLFQSDSILNNPDKDNIVMWGDGGTGYFFINQEALKNCDFSDILYFYQTC